MTHNIIEELCTENNHYLWIHIKEFSLDIGAIYRPESNSTDFKSFLDIYSAQLYKRKRGIVFGDFNIDLLNPDPSVKLYREMLHELDYQIINKISKEYCTRETATTKTLLDHVTSKLKERLHFAIIDSPMADHKQIYCEIKRYKPEHLKRQNYEAIDYKKLYKIMEEETNINKSNQLHHIEARLKSSIKRSKVNKTKIVNPPKQEWISNHIINEIKIRNMLWIEHKRYPEDETKKEKFIKKRNEVTKTIRNAKSQYYYKAFDDCNKKPTKMWRLISSLANNKQKNSTTPTKLRNETGYATTTKEICEAFNKYFSNIGSVLAEQIPKTSYQEASPRANEIALTGLSKLEPTTVSEISIMIDNLNCNTSAGIDGINPKCLKCVKNLIVHDLTNSINQCLEDGVFPDNLKIAKVTPIFKAGDRSEPGNYRPVSVLPILSKIFERVLYNRLMSFLNSINFLYDKQYGFRPKSNTLSATVDLVTDIKINIDKKKIALGVFIDLKKAFDTVSHTLLLRKLKDIGVTDTALKIFASYLCSRSQRVKIDQTESSNSPISYGVPQGSILGPLLFLIYINNIQDIGLKGSVTLYADDTSLFYFGNSISSVLCEAQHDLDLINTWFQSNLLTINVLKTNYIIFSAINKHIPSHGPLTINNIPLNQVHNEKYLGLILDSNLTWKPHLEKIKSKLLSLAGALRGIVQCLPKKVKYTIYNSLVKPHIEYVIEVWGTAAKTNLNIVQVAQNKLIKRLFNYDFLTSTEKVYRETGIMNLSETYLYKTCILIRKILSKDIHSKIVFTKKQQIQTKLLRNAKDIILRVPRTNYGRRNIMYEGAQLYNKLPKDIKQSKSMVTFKRLLKYYVKK